MRAAGLVNDAPIRSAFLEIIMGSNNNELVSETLERRISNLWITMRETANCVANLARQMKNLTEANSQEIDRLLVDVTQLRKEHMDLETPEVIKRLDDQQNQIELLRLSIEIIHRRMNENGEMPTPGKNDVENKLLLTQGTPEREST